MRIAIFSTMTCVPWGGSEELWSRAAHVLLAQGHQVSANVAGGHGRPEPLERLAAAGADIHPRSRRTIGRGLRRTWQRLGFAWCRQLRWLRRAAPDFVLISAGYHTDDLVVATACRLLGIPYGVVVQAAGPLYPIDPRDLAHRRDDYRGAARVFFLSQQNREIVERSLGCTLPQAEIVDNPFNVRPDAAPPWPESTDVWRLACVARIQFPSKGQDILIELLRMPKWRARPLEIVLWGEDGGSSREARDLVAKYGLEERIRFAGFSDDVEALWAEHHGLVLPARYEGGPMVLVEAMLCGRVPIITDVGYAGEFVDDNENGFLAPAATVEALDEALERAWQRREEWRAMGGLAAATIRDRHSLRPVEDFAARLLTLADRPTYRRAPALVAGAVA